MTFLRLLTAKHGDHTTNTLVQSPEELDQLQAEATAAGIEIRISHL